MNNVIVLLALVAQVPIDHLPNRCRSIYHPSVFTRHLSKSALSIIFGTYQGTAYVALYAHLLATLPQAFGIASTFLRGRDLQTR